ncbi:methyltransferase domain-containing protein [Streptomyces sp. NPDC000994]
MLGDGDNLPLASDSVDILTYAQAWHWTDQRKSVLGALRVLRCGGALALWWNDSDSTVSWIADQDARLRRLFGADDSEPDPMARFRSLPPNSSSLPVRCRGPEASRSINTSRTSPATPTS